MTKITLAAHLRRIMLPLLLVTGTGAIASCASITAGTNETSSSWRSGLAIQLFSFHEDVERDLPGTLARIKALGFERVETYPINGVSAGQLRAALDHAGLDAVSGHFSIDRLKNDLTGVIADAKILGLEQFGPSSIGVEVARDFRQMPLDVAEEAGATLKKACAAARREGMRVFIHTHGNEFAPVGGITPLDRIIQSSGGCIDIEADLAWVKWGSADPVQLINRYGHRVTSLHLKELAPGAMEIEKEMLTPEHFPIIGKGAIDWPGVMRASRAAGVRYYIIEDESADPAGQIPHTLAYLDSIIDD